MSIEEIVPIVAKDKKVVYRATIEHVECHNPNPLLTFCRDLTIRLWSVWKGVMVCHRAEILHGDMDLAGDILISSDMSSCVTMWRLEKEEIGEAVSRVWFSSRLLSVSASAVRELDDGMSPSWLVGFDVAWTEGIIAAGDQNGTVYVCNFNLFYSINRQSNEGRFIE